MKTGQIGMLVRMLLSLIVASVFTLGSAGSVYASGVIYVNRSASGLNNGSSWVNAYTSLQAAITHASSGTQIWVARGTYKPRLATDLADRRTKTFTLKNGVAIYGGFAGTETLVSQRNLVLNVTVLSGDIGIAGNTSDNSYHVVTGGGADSTASLDGFTITKGNANGDFVLRTAWGGGMFNSAGDPTLKNLIFRANGATYGGGMANDASNPTLLKVVFDANTAISNGGGMYNVGSTPKLVSVTFSGNQSGFQGGGMHNESGGTPYLTNVTFSGNQSANGGGMNSYASSANLTNVTFSGNTASTNGGGMKNAGFSNATLTNVTFHGNSAASGDAMYNDTSNPTIYNSIFWGDGTTEIVDVAGAPTISDSILSGGACPTGGTCTRVVSADPMLGLLQNNGGFTQTMALRINSAAIDAGDNATCAAGDQRSVLRPQGAGCDMGAYEVRARSFVSAGLYDGRVRESSETSSIGGAVNSTSATLSVGDDSLNRQLRGLVSFDTSSLPDQAKLVAAKLDLKQAGSISGDPFGALGTLWIDLAKPYFGLDVSLVSSDFQAAGTLSEAGSIGSTLSGSGWYTGSLNSLAVVKVNKIGTTQLRLRFDTDDNGNAAPDSLLLASGDAVTTADRPVLTVYYNP